MIVSASLIVICTAIQGTNLNTM